MRIEIDTARLVSPRVNATIQDAYFWLVAGWKALSDIPFHIRTERGILQAEVRFAEAFATTPLLEYDPIKGFTRGGVKVADEEISADPDYAHFVECRDRGRRSLPNYH